MCWVTNTRLFATNPIRHIHVGLTSRQAHLRGLKSEISFCSTSTTVRVSFSYRAYFSHRRNKSYDDYARTVGGTKEVLLLYERVKTVKSEYSRDNWKARTTIMVYTPQKHEMRDTIEDEYHKDETLEPLLNDFDEPVKKPFYRPRLIFLFVFLTINSIGSIFGRSMLFLRLISLYEVTRIFLEFSRNT